MAEFDLPFRFPPEVLLEAENIPTEITKEEIKKRRDFREILTFTIDPEDAKDFDDAISFRKLENGLYELGVHIADVSHYLKPNTALETDALDRATLCLPWWIEPFRCFRKIINELCSLRPNEDKLTFAAVLKWMATQNAQRMVWTNGHSFRASVHIRASARGH